MEKMSTQQCIDMRARIAAATTEELIAGTHLTDVEQFRLFGLDMVAAGDMDSGQVRGNNRFLWRFRAASIEQKDPKGQSAKFTRNGSKSTLVGGTPERLAMLKSHQERLMQEELTEFGVRPALVS